MKNKSTSAFLSWHPLQFAILLLALFGTAAGTMVLLEYSSPDDVQILDAWVEETTEQRTVLHVTLLSTGAKADRLVRVSTSIAERAIIFDPSGREVADLSIPADSEWVLGTTLPRIDLVGLKRTLKAQDTFDLLLGLRRAGKLHRMVRVEPVPDQRAPH